MLKFQIHMVKYTGINSDNGKKPPTANGKLTYCNINDSIKIEIAIKPNKKWNHFPHIKFRFKRPIDPYIVFLSN